uniref:DUF6598 domain-containing protein n=1 Tax=Arundo donax TaxID=35708 RepID=A0A0A9D0Z4_ARUDO
MSVRAEEIQHHRGDSIVPLHLGFVGESEKQPMEIEGGGSESAETLGPGRGKKRPPSPPALGGDEDSHRSATSYDADDWSVSESGSEEDDDVLSSQGTHRPLTVDDFPRVSCDYDEQVNLTYAYPQTKLRGPSPTMLFPAYKTGKHVFGSDYNLADKSEISVNNVGDCSNECRCYPMDLLQFIDAKIAGYQHTHPGRAKIFGFLAVRDTVEPLRNYVYRREIHNCEDVSVKRKTGVARLSLTSPARVISMTSRALIEFELHARSEDKSNGDNGPIIEGCTELYSTYASKSFIGHERLYGERCALDIKYVVLMNAVEARVEIKTLSLGGNVNMKLYAKTSGFSEVIRLFQGAAPEPGCTMTFVVAAEKRSGFDLYIEGSPRVDPILAQKPLPYSWWRCGFTADYHRMDEDVAELGKFAIFSVKVTWNSYRKKALRG